MEQIRRETETETETKTDQMIRSKGVYFDYQLKFCLEARTVYIQGSELTEQILVRI